jgi:hypothetical protein
MVREWLNHLALATLPRRKSGFGDKYYACQGLSRPLPQPSPSVTSHSTEGTANVSKAQGHATGLAPGRLLHVQHKRRPSSNEKVCQAQT